MWKMKLNLWNNLIILVDWYIKSTRLFWKFQLLFLRGAFHVLFQESADWAQRRSRVGRLWCCMAWVVPLCFFSPPGLRRVSKSTGYSILTSTIWNFKIYILSPRKKTIKKFPQQQKANILGFLIIGAFLVEPTSKKNFTKKPLTGARLLDFHPAPRHTALPQRLRTAFSAAGRLAGLAAAGGGGGTRCQWQDGGEGGGDSKGLGVFLFLQSVGDLYGGFKCSTKNRLNILFGRLLVNYMISFRWIETSKL